MGQYTDEASHLPSARITFDDGGEDPKRTNEEWGHEYVDHVAPGEEGKTDRVGGTNWWM